MKYPDCLIIEFEEYTYISFCDDGIASQFQTFAFFCRKIHFY